MNDNVVLYSLPLPCLLSNIGNNYAKSKLIKARLLILGKAFCLNDAVTGYIVWSNILITNQLIIDDVSLNIRNQII